MSKNRKKGNSFMEWFSDNLRYILLIGAIFLILAGLFFGVRAISSGMDKKANESGTVTEDAGNDTSKKNTATAETGNKSAGSAVSADHGTLTESTDKDITKLVEDYYAALSVQDLAKVRETTDTLPDEQAARISSSKVNYDNVKVYSKNGPDENSRVVYAYYTYQGDDQSAPVPGLSQLYVKKGADGTWKIVYSPLTEDEKNYIDSVTQDADVQALIEQVKQEYNEKLNAAAGTAQSSEKKTEDEDSGSGNDEEDEEAGEESGDDGEEEDGSDEETAAGESDEEEKTDEESDEVLDDRLGTPDDRVDDEETIDEETIDEETIDEETIDEDSIDEDSTDEDEYNEESGDDEPEDEESQTEWTAEVNSSCNLRDGASYDSAVLGTVTAGTEVTVIGDIVNGWWHIRTEDAEGYIGGKFID